MEKHELEKEFKKLQDKLESLHNSMTIGLLTVSVVVVIYGTLILMNLSK